MASGNRFSFVLIALAFFIAVTYASSSCLNKLSLNSKLMTAQTACVTTLKLNASDIPTVNNMKERHHDKCLSNCTLENLNFYRNGTFLKDAMLQQIKQDASTDVYDKLTKVIETCIEKANSKPEHKNKDKMKHNKDGQNKGNMVQVHMMRNHTQNMCNCKKAFKFVSCVTEMDKDLC